MVRLRQIVLLAACAFSVATSAFGSARHASEFPQLKLLTIADIAGSWAEAQKVHFHDGAVFDQIYRK